MNTPIATIWTWLNQEGTALGVVLAAIPLVWGGVTYLRQKRKELLQARFETYHRLIAQLVTGENGVTYLDRQIAIVYELRRFKEYRQVSLRILRSLRDTWSAEKRNERLIHEMDLAICYIRKKLWRIETFR